MQAEADKSASNDEDSLNKMSFGDHLEELRRRIVLSLIAVGVCVFAMLPFKTQVTAIYVQPYHDMWIRGFADYLGHVETMAAELPDDAMWQDQWQWLTEHSSAILLGSFDFDNHGHFIKSRGGYQVPHALMATGGIEDFWTFMAASFLFALIIAAPFVAYQMWAFIAAGLYARERKVVLRYLPLGIVLLVAGVSFGYFLVVPYGLFFLVGLMNFGQVQPLISVSQYFSLLFTLTAALGFVFQLPVVMLALQKVGLVSHSAFRKQWRYIILGIFVLSAMLTPPDPFTQLMMGMPVVGLYCLGLVLTYRAEKSVAAAS